MRRNPKILGVVLSGGKSKRMGKDKSKINLRGKTFLDRSRESLSCTCDQVWADVPDDPDFAGHGPLSGIATALRRAPADFGWLFFLPCDSPLVSAAFVGGMRNVALSVDEGQKPFDIICCRHSDGSWEPLHALYRRTEAMASAAAAGAARQAPVIRALHDAFAVRSVGDDEVRSWSPSAPLAFMNANTPRELAMVVSEVARQHLAETAPLFATGDAREYVPAYVRLMRQGKLDERVGMAKESLASCTLCGRRCAVDRIHGAVGVCKTGSEGVWADGAQPHFGEESVLVGRKGSGTIFLTSCNLLCVFCQNHEISHGRRGDVLTCRQMADEMLALQNERWCHNINLVTPTHQLPMLLESLAIAAREGLRVPLVWNCGGFESPEALALLDGVVDIYMPDFKFWDPAIAAKLAAGCSTYPEVARAALKEMHRQVGPLVLDSRTGVALHGLLVRHLVMPNGTAGTAQFVHWLATEVSRDTYINVMDQYRPCFRAKEIEEIARTITVEEYVEALFAAVNEGLRVHVE